MFIPYSTKKYDHLFGLSGQSDTLLKNHLTLYEGYVNNTNKVAERLSVMAQTGETGTPEYAELTRRFGWEWNGMRLHEYYFDNLTKESLPLEKNNVLSKKITEFFGSLELWEKNFRATGVLRGIGWVALMRDNQTGNLFNVWINEHDGGYLADAAPLIVMDVFEHAYMLDYGLKRAEYIDAFFRALSWTEVEKRFSEKTR